MGRSTYTGESYDIVTIKYAPNGDSLWSARYTGSTHEYDGAVDICVDEDSNIYITGHCDVGFLDGDWITIKYDPDGNFNVFVTGNSNGKGTSADYTTIKYRQNPLIHKVPVEW